MPEFTRSEVEQLLSLFVQRLYFPSLSEAEIELLKKAGFEVKFVENGFGTHYKVSHPQLR